MNVINLSIGQFSDFPEFRCVAYLFSWQLFLWCFQREYDILSLYGEEKASYLCQYKSSDAKVGPNSRKSRLSYVPILGSSTVLRNKNISPAAVWSWFSFASDLLFLAAAMPLLITISSSVGGDFFLRRTMLPHEMGNYRTTQNWLLNFSIVLTFKLNF